MNDTNLYADVLGYTYAYSKYSCVESVYPLHIAMAYMTVLAGILAMVSRVVKVMMPYHTWFGKLFVIFMFWCMAASLLIHNTGLPLPIIVFFIFLLVTLTIGWLVIRLHTQKMEEEAFRRIDTIVQSQKISEPIAKLFAEQKMNIANEKTFKERLFSYKALHGLMMVFCWYQMLGRTMVTNPVPGPGCWTYPAFKSSNGEAMFIPAEDPHYAFQGKELSFILSVSIPSFIFFMLFGVVYSWVAARRAKSEEKVLLLNQEKI
eukprot:TRINITY_DN704_c0_g1_i1.p1 TRINITY_DN704_c0_g1~~TRINITY_DN704_c0_g1_i1.p1  ORF type:complete len:261 (-),score=16.18 TRINITY_DN704_c0_g1_i1:55-837(-)